MSNQISPGKRREDSLDEKFEKHLGRKLEEIGKELVRQAKEVECIVKRLSRELNEKKRNAIVNKLGELQITGTRLDRLCAEFCFYQREIDEIAYMRALFAKEKTFLSP